MTNLLTGVASEVDEGRGGGYPNIDTFYNRSFRPVVKFRLDYPNSSGFWKG